MFILLSRVLLWLLVGTIVYSLFQRFYPQGTFAGRVVLVIILVVIALSFINPNEPAVASLWRVISFPLKPLGASVLMMIFAAQKIKDGGIAKPGGTLLAASLIILLLSSTPAIAYFLVRSPIAATAINSTLTNQALVRNYLPAGATGSEVLVALNPGATTSDVNAIAFNAADIKIPPYLLQNPQQIRERGLRLEDFVPSAETLQLTTQVWESYLNQVYFFLRGRQS
ncbi:hypothetical protein BCD64_23395 [Nostoc sp. MBR 210]|uniref:Uncharacterized protein n=1 Tax=Nostoc spongiaeforme FACHB-130 TaxID=1357510 RepID=A0ABR8FX35_9NOSO|nr:hypothetical protein [Nostoc spongiaeforme]MBD2594910.1 hypothetical protein [Nostoc spongiaeforme FACHB-130]OCQ98987.1 hypothetical protein BCD64_23395 [Nostoc sp. MBR 210]